MPCRPSLLHGYVILNRFLPPNWAAFYSGFPVDALWTRPVEVLFLSRLTWIQERLKWWRLHPGLASTQPFNFQVFIKRDEIQEAARVLARASLQQWQVEHLSTFQVFRSQETAHSTIRNFIELVFWPFETPMLMTFTLDRSWQLMLCKPKWTFRCVSSSVFIAASSYTGSKEGLWYHDQ